MNERNILCIDLKSFFASVECVERKLDPFKVPLVVSDISHGEGAITLAITPYLKKMGVSSRTRVFKLPRNIKIIFAKPRMKLYLSKSKEVFKIYLKYVSSEDMHVYSIDEAFLDVTDYLKLYKMDDVTLAKTIMNDVYQTLGLTATCGIGPNLLLSKIALDIESKNCKDNIAKWTYKDIKTKLHNITPLSEMWGIGQKYEKKLNDLGIFKVGDINKYDINFYKKRFGIMGEELWYHANGIDFSNIKDKNKISKNYSYGISQILHKDYTIDNINIIIKEMSETISRRLKKENKECGCISFGISYSKTIGGGFYHSKKISNYTDNDLEIYKVCKSILDIYALDYPIRKVSISLSKINIKNNKQLNIFENFEETNKKEILKNTIYDIRKKFGNNAIVKASALTKDSTILERNTKLGGHNKE